MDVDRDSLPPSRPGDRLGWRSKRPTARRARTPSPATTLIARSVMRRLNETCGATVLGICDPLGVVGPGVARELESVLDANGVYAARLSLDDLCLAREARAELARRVHPLLATRGSPGAHDAAAAIALIQDLRLGRVVTIPIFDKLSDDIAPKTSRRVGGPTDVVILEGWFVGARPQAPQALVQPVSDLELRFDGDRALRKHANEALAGGFRSLFQELDMLTLIHPTMGDVMSSPDRLIRERLTRHICSEMQSRADLVIQLDHNRAFTNADSPAQGFELEAEFPGLSVADLPFG